MNRLTKTLDHHGAATVLTASAFAQSAKELRTRIETALQCSLADLMNLLPLPNCCRGGD